MAIQIKSKNEISAMKRACRITARARQLAGEMTSPGIPTMEIDREVRRLIEKEGAVPSFLNYNGFPKSVCISVNEEVIHGIPGARVIGEGDLVSVDVGAYIGGFHGDAADTFSAGTCSKEAEELIQVTRQSFFKGLEFAREGCRVSDIGSAIQEYVESFGFSVVRDFVGHGVGRSLHEAPEVPNFGIPGRGPRLIAGMTLAIEPMVCMGVPEINVLGDDWTVVTADGSLSTHYENTVLITDGAPEILTVI